MVRTAPWLLALFGQLEVNPAARFEARGSASAVVLGPGEPPLAAIVQALGPRSHSVLALWTLRLIPALDAFLDLHERREQ